MQNNIINYLKNEIKNDFGNFSTEGELNFKGIDLNLSNGTIKELGRLMFPFGSHKSTVLEVRDGFDTPTHVIKAYSELRSDDRTINDILNSYTTAHEENPTKFPRATKTGEGVIYVNGSSVPVIVIKQEYIPAEENKPLSSYLEEGFNEKAVDICLNKLENLAKEHKRSPSGIERKEILEIVNCVDSKSFEIIKRNYYGYSLLQAEPIIKELKKREGYNFLRDIECVDVSDFKITRIIGDYSPKQAIIPGEWCTYDSEKYNYGVDIVEHVPIIEWMIPNIGLKMVKKYIKYIEKRHGKDTLTQIMLAILGYRGGWNLYPLAEKDLNFNKKRLKIEADLFKEHCS